jgi:integrase
MDDTKGDKKKASGRRGLGGIYRRPETAVWWVRYSYRGKRTRESSGSTNRADAVRLLKQRLGEMGQGKVPGRDAERVTLADLGQMLVNDYRLKGNRSTARVGQALAHVREYFGDNERALNITADRLTNYALQRQDAGAKPATVKCELAALRRGFNLAVRADRLPQRPAFPVIQCHNRREGFFEDAEYRAVLEHLPPDVAPVAEFLYWTGWRSGEAKALEWRHVDLTAGIIRIENSKNREPRTYPFKVLPELASLIERQRERTTAIEQAHGIIVPWVFWRQKGPGVRKDGTPVRRFDKAWNTACVAAGLGHEVRDADGKLVKKVRHRTPHDYRRSAARNQSRAGVTEPVIMKLCGWKTRSVFDRYRIVNEADLADGLAKLAGATTTTGEAAAPKVVPIRTGTERAQKG